MDTTAVLKAWIHCQHWKYLDTKPQSSQCVVPVPGETLPNFDFRVLYRSHSNLTRLKRPRDSYDSPYLQGFVGGMTPVRSQSGKTDYVEGNDLWIMGEVWNTERRHLTKITSMLSWPGVTGCYWQSSVVPANFGYLGALLGRTPSQPGLPSLRTRRSSNNEYNHLVSQHPMLQDKVECQLLCSGQSVCPA